MHLPNGPTDKKINQKLQDIEGKVLMKATLKRISGTEYGIFSTLTIAGKTFYTLEHAYPKEKSFSPKIEGLGEYQCKRGPHTLHSGPIETFEVLGVQGHSGILFHVGNFNKDSEGCILVGLSKSDKQINESTKAFAEFMELLKGVNEFTLEVT